MEKFKEWREKMSKWKIYNEDAVSWAKNYGKGRFHALLTDTPYNLESIIKRFGKNGSVKASYGKDGVFQRSSRGFMNAKWDTDIAFRPETWEAFGEVLYPGAFGMAFSASRNWHRMAVAIEDAGFILHPTIFLWAQGQGFPKATNISKQIDKQNGVEPIKGNLRKNGRGADPIKMALRSHGDTGIGHADGSHQHFYEELPNSDDAKAWEGHRYGLQALKPAVEPIIVFQKPYEGRPLDNIVETGAGALNIDASRIPTQDEYVINQFDDGMKPFGNGAGHKYTSSKTRKSLPGDGRNSVGAGMFGEGTEVKTYPIPPSGRWPANLILDGSAERLDAQTGTLQSGKPSGKKKADNNIYGKYKNEDIDVQGFGDTGGASRFFYNVSQQLDESDPMYYCGKVSPKERQAGLDEKNIHPTLKPIDLCRYLATLLLPPEEYAPRRIFIPFSGVASEMIGAMQAGWEHIVGVEFDTENGYVDIAHKRMEYWSSK
jgi:hypothetical protein